MESKGRLTAEYILKGKLNFPIPEEGTDTADATATAAEILDGKTAYVQGKKILGIISNRGDVIITPKADEDQTLEEGYYSNGTIKKVTANVDENIVAENIKKGVTILDVTGTLEYGVDTKDADAAEDDIEMGKTAYVDGQKITGTIPVLSKTYVTSDTDVSKTDYNVKISTTVNNKSIIDSNSTIELNVNNYTLASTLGITENDIMSGKTILDITGTATNDADATAADLVKDKTAYCYGEQITGTIDIEQGEKSLELQDLSYITDIDGDYFQIPMNKENKRVISSTEEVLSNEELELTYKIPASVIANLIGLTADKIKSGETVLGITGTAE